jgi:hypothetical protein
MGFPGASNSVAELTTELHIFALWDELHRMHGELMHRSDEPRHQRPGLRGFGDRGASSVAARHEVAPLPDIENLHAGTTIEHLVETYFDALRAIIARVRKPEALISISGANAQ